MKPKEKKPYTMYDRAIGPVKPYPLPVFKKSSIHVCMCVCVCVVYICMYV